jgi:toxin ParE1/3/4
MEVNLAQSALDDLHDLQQYYSDQGVSDVGMQFVKAILEATERLVDHPDSGRKVPEFNQDEVREIMFSLYRIVYLRDPAAISIIRVWREERELVLR